MAVTENGWESHTQLQVNDSQNCFMLKSFSSLYYVVSFHEEANRRGHFILYEVVFVKFLGTTDTPVVPDRDNN